MCFGATEVNLVTIYKRGKKDEYNFFNWKWIRLKHRSCNHIFGFPERVCKAFRCGQRSIEILQTDYSEIDIEDLIEKEDVVVSLTHAGYIKRVSVSEYKTQKRGGKGVIAHKPKEEDFVEHMFITNTHNRIMFFTNLGKVYCMKAYAIPEGQKAAKGRAIINLLELSEGERNEIFNIRKRAYVR